MTSGISKGVPLTDTTNLFWATSGPPDAPIVIVGEAWGSEERARGGRPFVGAAGVELDRMLAEAGLTRDSILCTNLHNGQPERNDLATLFEPGAPTLAGLRPGPAITTGLERLHRQLAAFPRKLIIAAGNYPTWALTNETGTAKAGPPNSGVLVPTGITDLRGSQLFAINDPVRDRTTGRTPLLPVIHPATILRQWSNRAITVHDLRTRVPLALRNEWTRPTPYRFDHRPSFERAIGQLSTWLYAKKEITIACDIETKGNCIITCIGFADSADYALCIPFVNVVGTGRDRRLTSYWGREDELRLWRLLCALFRAPHVLWAGQNFLYDLQYINADFGLVPRLWHDTLIAQNLLFPGTPKGLGHLSSIYCAHHRYWKDDSREWSTKGTLDQHLLYNCEDAARTWEIAAAQRQVLDITGLTPHWPFELYKFNLAWRMMKRGIRRDPDATHTVGLHIIERVVEIENALMRIAPQATLADSGIKSKKLWPTSWKQFQYLLYDVWKLDVQRDKKTKRPSTGKIALQALTDRYPRLHHFFDLLAEYRSLRVIYSNFISSKLEPDGRMRGSFNPAGTETYRWSSSKNAFNRGGNMQNIPAGGAEDWVETMIEEENDT